jgi:glutamine amidotransferase
VSGLVIVDYGMGNIGSVVNAFSALGTTPTVSSDPTAVRAAGALVLPGVGAFGAAMENLRARGLVEALTSRVMGDCRPFLGICLGLQLIARDSVEQGHWPGLGWIDGHVVELEPAGNEPVPHLQCRPEHVVATCEYGGQWVAAVRAGHVMAVQFHPEKSDRNGLRVLRNFLRYAAESGC